MRIATLFGIVSLAMSCSGRPSEHPADAPIGVDAQPRPPGPDMGANVTDTGVRFRVWAPHASAVSVTGDFTDAPLAMTAEADGAFAVESSAAHVGSRYYFELDTDAGHVVRVDPYCRQLADSVPSCLVVDPGAFAWHDQGFAAADLAHSIVYELHVGSFAMDASALQGTFTSARDRLADLRDLGVTVVELMPSQAFGGTGEHWGYDPELYFVPEPSYGTPDDLRAFVDEAHRLGIAVWLDFVANHYEGYRGAALVCYDGSCPNGAWGVHFFPPGDYAVTPWGPRPNYSEPRVATMLEDSVAQWISEFHGDGLRWDSVSNIRAIDGSGTTPGGRELMTAANDLVHRYGGLSIAEDLKGDAAITQPSGAGGFGFDAQWDGFSYDLANVIIPASDDGRDMGSVETVVRGGFDHLMSMENHDTVGAVGRLPVRIDNANPESFAARRRSMIVAALLMTSPGVPMVFMGEEALATAPFADPVEPLPAPTAAGARMRAFYKDLIALRRGLAGQTGGLAEAGVDILHRNDDNKVIAYRRSGPSNEDVIVVLNLRDRSYSRYDIGVPASGTWKVRIDADWTTYGADFGGGTTAPIETLPQPKDGQPNTLPLPLPAYGVLVLSR